MQYQSLMYWTLQCAQMCSMSVVLLGVYDFHIKSSHSTAAVSGEFWLSTDSQVTNLVKMLDYSQKVSDRYLTTI